MILLILSACNQEKTKVEVDSVNWDERAIDLKLGQNDITGSSYLSVYSEIYDHTDKTAHLLTATVSIRNTSVTDSLFILKADYYNTKGELSRSYVKSPVFLTPLETIEIIIPRLDRQGGSGANFIFDWTTRKNKNEPLFEAVMVWTTGNQGISFVTRGVKL